MRTFAVTSLLAAAASAQNGLWVQLTFPSSPTPRYGASMAYDSARDRLVLISGMPTVFGGMQETWENDGSQWIFRGAIGPWGAIGEAAIVYDSARQVCVAVRSPTGGGTFETWEWAGTSWVLRAPATSPPGRRGFVMAYDTARQRTVLYGGYVGSTHLADTWEYDGAAWVLRATGGPPGRAYAAMAFDRVRGVCVLYAGRNDAASINFTDTWEWNGTFWLQRAISSAPGPRYEHAMVFDSLRGRCVVTGGRTQNGNDVTSTWEWDGTTWTDKQAPSPLPGGPALAFDTTRQRTVSFGGRFFSSNIQDGTYAYGAPAVVATATPYGAGCAGPNGVPLLATVGNSVPRLGGTLQLRLSSLPAGFLNVPLGWVGFDDAVWNGLPLPLALDPLGFPGCSALLAPASAFALVNNGGVADWQLAIPFLPAFAGLEFFVQGAVVAIGFNPGGLVFSNAVACTVGR
jgi:hypothetical protein